jgi:hypothetical protein
VLLQTVHRLAHDSFLIVKQTQFQKSICLRLLVPLLVGDAEQVLQVLNSSLNIAIFGMSICQLLVSFSCFSLVVSFNTKIQKHIQILYSLCLVALLLTNVADFLVALSFLNPVLSSFGSIEALLEEIESFLEIILVLELNGYYLVDSYQLLTDVLLNFREVSVYHFL